MGGRSASSLASRIPGFFAAALLAAATSAGQAVPAAGLTARQQARIDSIFSSFTSRTPGCAVGVARDGTTLVEKAYGLADLEHGVPNRPDTIFEVGSVSKQVTAAAVLLLAREGRLALDDPVSKYIPDLPDYGTPLTVRHMLTHTGGLRDWGELAAIAGWPRGTRVHTHAHVLEIAARQRALNFPPGTNWSYSNTGYNLAAMIVSRVAGKPFAEFCRERLFEPFHMTNTSWRDDHARVVPGRATAYGEEEDGYRVRMPFEDVHGNGGLLTTAADLLRWNRRFDVPSPDEAEMVRQQQEPATLTNGERLDYALGLFVRVRNGVTEVAHGGGTGGYEAFLARYPAERLSVAVLCNLASAGAEGRARAVADVFLPTKVAKPVPSSPVPVADAFLRARVGLYRSTVTGRSIKVLHGEGGLQVEGGAKLVPATGSRFAVAGGSAVIEFGESSAVILGEGLPERYERVDAARPSEERLRSLTGIYVSEEADAVYGVVLQKGALRLWRRPNVAFALEPAYEDAFEARGLGTIRFYRQDGRVTEMSITGARVWDLRFRRVQ
jgi:CubicO group peptidase (beta-lactamase class C family)